MSRKYRRNGSILLLFSRVYWPYTLMTASLLAWQTPSIVNTIIRPVEPITTNFKMYADLMHTLAGVFFYLISVILLVGSFINFFRRFYRISLYHTIFSQPTIRKLNSLSWRQFELLVGEAFRKAGYKVVERGGKGPDGGVDLLLKKDGAKIVVQIKHWKSARIGVSVVRELAGIIRVNDASRGIIVGSGSYTRDAVEFAKLTNIDLMTGKDLLALVSDQIKNMKFDQLPADIRELKLSTPVCPECSSPMVERRAKKGMHKGSNFWGCSRYPHCHGTLSSQ